ncbi:MAG: MFS transporter [Polyangiaceae bacterium]|nr:MFS transporter [Polyangiaceae bacterium]
MRKASIGTIFFTVFLDLLGFGLVVPYLPGVARDLGASPFLATLLGAVYSAMQFLFVPMWGHFSDRWGRRPILLVSIALTAVGMAALGTATTLTGLFIARAFVGMATANLAVASAYIADITGPENRSRGMGAIGAAIGLGFVLGPVFGGLLQAHSPIQRVGAAPAYAAAALSALNFVLAAITLPESLRPEIRGKAVRSLSPFDRRRFQLALGTPKMVAALAVQFVIVLSFSGMEQTFRLFTTDEFGFKTEQTGYVLGVVGVVLITVQAFFIRLFARVFSERALVRTGVLIEALGFAGVALSPAASGAKVGLLVVSMAVIAFGSGLANPSLSALVSRSTQPSEQGSALGTLQSVGALARVFGPTIAGLLYQSLGPQAPYAAAAVGMLIAGAVSFGLGSPSNIAVKATPVTNV